MKFRNDKGDFIVHFSKKNKPVLMEILNAASFFKETSRVFPKNVLQSA